jgi:hypothetical protein
MTQPGSSHATTPETGRLLELAENLATIHREHEKHYGAAPLRTAQRLLEHSLTLKALAERWRLVTVREQGTTSPLAGADDLNDPRAIETSGVLFLESGERPPELMSLRGDLLQLAGEATSTGTYLAHAMETSWEMANGLLMVPELDDLLAERHAIIARDAYAATLLSWQARRLRRAVEILDRVDFRAEALRADLAGPRRAPALLFAAAELIDGATDACVQAAGLVRQNERPWRLFHDRVEQITGEAANGRGSV